MLSFWQLIADALGCKIQEAPLCRVGFYKLFAPTKLRNYEMVVADLQIQSFLFVIAHDTGTLPRYLN
jgi:hypothetical protein